MSNDKGMKDAIIGAISNYDVPHILLYVASLLKSGFTGDKFMVVYDVGYAVVEFLEHSGFTVFKFNDVPHEKRYVFRDKGPHFHINVDRFYHMWLFLSKLPVEQVREYRYLISTDVGDVVFQSNPSVWLEENLGNAKLNAACESIKFKDELMFGAPNMKKSFGDDIFNHMKNRLIFNAGTLSGHFNYVRDMFLNIFLMSQGYGTVNPDQAAYNVLLSMEPYHSITKFNMSESGWAAQMGTTCDSSKLEHFGGEKVVEPVPVLDTDNIIVKTSTGIPFVIVHQYNRVNWLIPLLFKKYLGDSVRVM